MPKYRRTFTPRTAGQTPAVPHFRAMLRESALAVEVSPLQETVSGAAVTHSSDDGRMLLQLISEGWGSSGYYSGAVLEQAARDRRFAAGLHLYLDHPSASEEHDRPERSVRDLAAVLTEDARYDADRRALVALAKPLPTYRDLLSDKDFVEAVGLSIRAGGLAEYGTAEGRDGLIVQEIRDAASVDFVTRAGRGGKVLALLESARTRLRESPTEATRTLLDHAIRAAYVSGERSYAYVRDFDPVRGVVWFETGGAGESACWEQPYRDHATGIELYGPRRQVLPETVYRPVVVTDYVESAEPAPTTTDVTDGAPPTGSPNPPREQEPDMSGTNTGGQPGQAGTATVVDTAAIQIEAREAAAARDTAVRERDTALQEAADATARATRAEQELARFRAVEKARPIIEAQLAEAGLPRAAQAKVVAGVVARVPLTEAGLLDEAALKTLVEAEATAEKTYLAQLAEASGAGRVAGFGQTAQPTGQAPASPWATPDAEPNTALVEAYRNRGLSAEAAVAAARGRAV
ncbi:hypothetical protein Drose_06240 [Dactylosporangium roseum]|uniref:Uncharacterized protein n=1 Tax=Dactylosporangium roseum TaxID=47989 RepID=A0ABY5Z760_9ACTN|nr:hypothetical protein [Dactylosporangium roseum]UWZ37871.1 hypothetical protein Drose_06240 [Dactylosporangium roseum]